MAASLPVRTLAAAAEPPVQPLWVAARWLYASNPFYLISAGLIMGGLHLLFYDHDAAAHPNALTFNSWLLLGILSAYAVLLATTSWVIVRFGQVWDDARTILLTIVLLFVAMSVSFDKLVLTQPDLMAQLLSLGLLFAIVLAEVLFDGLRVRLPILYRGPFYLAMTLFYLYPIALLHMLETVGDRDARQGLEWTLAGVILFPALAGLVALMLLPAAWMGPEYVRGNGTPWGWPLFPWSLFTILAVGVALRSYSLTLSFHPYPGKSSGFAAYSLTPFLLSVSVLIFEIGRSCQRATVQNLALIAPMSLLFWAMPGESSPASRPFLQVHLEMAGSPLLVAWWGLVALETFAWLRGSRVGQACVLVLLAVGSLLDGDTLGLETLQFPDPRTLAVLGSLSFVLAVSYPSSSWRWFFAWVCALAAATAALWETPFVAFGGALPFHLLLAMMLMLSLIFQDTFAHVLRLASCAGLVGAAWLSLSFGLSHELNLDLVVFAYLVLLASIGWSYWWVQRSVMQACCAVLLTICVLAHGGHEVGIWLQAVQNPRAAALVLGGACSFVLAVAISLVKAGVCQRGRSVAAGAAKT